MAYVRKTFTTRKPKTTTKRVIKKYTKKRKSVLSSVKSMVKREISKNTENKSTSDDPLTYPFNVNNSSCSQAVSLIPAIRNIAQGTTDGQRIGNKINVKKCILNMNFTCQGTTGGTGPYYVMFFIGHLKADPGTQPNATDLSRLLNDGGASVGLTNSTLTMLRNINRDYFTISYTKKFKLGFSQNNGLLLSQPNNDFPVNRQFKINLKKLCGQIVYNDAATSINRHLFIWCHYISLDSQLNTVQSPILLDYYVDVNYEDA